MRDKLIEILLEREAVKDANAYDRAESLADFLLEKGVIVPPFPIGTTYYRIVTRSGKFAGEYRVIREAILNYYNIDNVMRDFGKTVFLTREEAEQALQEARNEVFRLPALRK